MQIPRDTFPYQVKIVSQGSPQIEDVLNGVKYPDGDAGSTTREIHRGAGLN